MKSKTPKIAEFFLKLFLRSELKEHRLGDYEEIFHYKVESEGVLKAKLWYWSQTLRSIPRFIYNSIYWGNEMFKKNLKIAVRNLLKYKFYSFINITGLAIAIAASLLILLFVQDELSYDKYNENADRIYRVVADLKLGGSTMIGVDLGAPTAEALANDFPEVEKAVRIKETGSYFVSYGYKSFIETKVIKADSTFFDIFTIPLLEGNPKTALSRPNSLVLSKKMVEKYFGNEEPIGKTLRLNDRDDYMVTGVFDKIPSNSHFHTDFILSLQIKPGGNDDYWLGSMNYVTYILLPKEYDYKNLEAKFPTMTKKYVGPEIQMFLGKSLEETIKEGNKVGYYLQPLTDIHLYSNFKGELEPNGDIKYVLIFSAIGLFILLIACVNFMNLSTASSSNRAKEVGIKKVLGSGKSELVKQFLTESVVMSSVGTFLALIIVLAALPIFNNLAGKELTISYLFNPLFFVMILLVTLFIGLLAGSYPALFISSFTPAAVLKGKIRTGTKGSFLRSSMVVFQFTASIIMLIATTVVFNQLNYMQNKKLGFEKDQEIIVHNAFILGDQANAFRDEVTADSRIASGTIAGSLPVESSRNSHATFRDARTNDEKLTSMQSWYVDYNYVPTLGLELVKGRNFSKDFGNDSKTVIINEAAAKHFEWNEPIGKHLSQYTSNSSEIATYTVIGVVKDFHFESMKNTIAPVLLFLKTNNLYAVFKFNSHNTTDVVNLIKDKWAKFVPGGAFEFSFMDEDFNEMYKAEQKIGEIFSVFTILAMLIACLGIFGLAAFTAAQRTKEIGIRKVFGASILRVILLLSKDFAKLVLVAFVISIPVAYYYMNNWLEDFAYRTNISIWVFIFAGVSAIFITLATVSYQSIKAALANPIDSIKYE